MLYDIEEEKSLWKGFLDREKVFEVINICDANSIYYNIYTENEILTEKLQYNLLFYHKENTFKEKDMNEKAMKKVVEVDIEDTEDETDVENEIIKYQTYEIRPMDRENAKILLSSQKKQLFLTFIDIETNKVNVIFKLKDGKNFGIVEPEI